jgi:hypothetical protein
VSTTVTVSSFGNVAGAGPLLKSRYDKAKPAPAAKATNNMALIFRFMDGGLHESSQPEL